MDPSKRTELIESYYAAIDDEAFERLREVFDDDVEYRYPGEPDMHGVDDVLAFFRERRAHSDSVHAVHRRVVDDEVTICEGTVEAAAPDGSRFEIEFVGVFEFDDDARAIDRVGVYVRR